MRRTVIITLLVAAWMVGPVVRVQDAPVPPSPEPSPTMTISR